MQAGHVNRTADHTVVGETGRRIRIRGAFDRGRPGPGGPNTLHGTIDSWMPGQNVQPACLVRLDAPITAEGDVRGEWRSVTGEYVVLELRYTGQVWEGTGTVHVELCAERPLPLGWAERSPGAWVEGQATYELIE